MKQHRDCKDSHEYQDYLANHTRGNAGAFISSILELHGDAPQRDVYLTYIDERPGSKGLFTDEGVPIVISQIQQEMNNHPGNIWTHIISLRREDAERLGYNTTDAWMHLLRSQRNMIAQQMKISPENFRWYAAFHNEGHHPHVHMMAYSANPNEAYLSTKGIETIKSNLAQEIFRQDLLQIYQKQLDIRDELRQESRDRITEIVDAINHGSFDNPQMQMMLVQIADRLAKTKSKNQYGYLNASTKKLVDAIVAELAGDSRIRELCSLCYEQKEDVLRTYTNKMPERIPLEQQKEFRTIRNAVVQAALQLQLPQEELPLSDPVPPRVDFVDDGSDVYPKAAESLRAPEVEPDPEVNQLLHEAAIRGSVDAVYGIGKQIIARIEKSASDLPGMYPAFVYKSIMTKLDRLIENRVIKASDQQRFESYLELKNVVFNGNEEDVYMRVDSADASANTFIFSLLKKAGYYDSTVNEFIKHLSNKRGAHIDIGHSEVIELVNDPISELVKPTTCIALQMIWAVKHQVPELMNYWPEMELSQV